MATVFTIGHSNRSWEDFLSILKAHGIRTLIDIRRFPSSAKWPQFNRETMRKALAVERIEYLWLEALGGRRHSQSKSSPNLGLRNAGFRNYADHMHTAPFAEAIGEVLRRAAQTPAAIMCAEALYFRCHRMLVSDWLVAHGHEVLHLQSTGAAHPHRLTNAARITNGRLTYPGENLF